MDDYEGFKKQIFTLTQIDLNAYKEKQMRRRIDSLITKHGIKSYPDYVAAMENLSVAYDLPIYNTYTGLGIDGTNHTEYLIDGCHPNEQTRYTMAQKLAKIIQRASVENE